ncbi:hypothetical protein BDM02DRAFT_3117246 [Thelephora ganbajun]|uniref:Uncharacterized protein n=1 Tax=Thelephora ganbajun TaxID=370292 RepID=A0ACB6ZD66_THEGA|nr:hypothetical protein BDM02DRAFT_3117246 [Thelephora ganbajun]
MFFSENFMLGAGAVIIQPSSGKVVIVQDGNSWFLPKGRKDLGESIEQAALREAYEESGYRCEFLPLYHWTNAPVHSRLVYGQKHTEPLHVTITSYAARRNRPPGEYLTFWYACQIGPGAVRELGTGMPDEVGYIGHLVTYEVANRMLGEVERTVLTAARNEWIRSIEIDEQIRTAEAQREGTIEFE